MIAVEKIAKTMPVDKEELLLRFFEHAPEWVFEKCKYITVRRQVEFVREEKTADTIYILTEGQVYAKDYRVTETSYSFKKYAPLIMLGDMEVVIHSPVYITSLSTYTECRFITIPRKTYQKWMEQDHQAFWIQTELMTKSFLNGARKDRSFLFLEGVERLYLFFVNLYEANGSGGILQTKITRKELGDEVGCSVRTINRALNKMKEQGCIHVKVSNITVAEDQYLFMKQYLKEKISEM